MYVGEKPTCQNGDVLTAATAITGANAQYMRSQMRRGIVSFGWYVLRCFVLLDGTYRSGGALRASVGVSRYYPLSSPRPNCLAAATDLWWEGRAGSWQTGTACPAPAKGIFCSAVSIVRGVSQYIKQIPRKAT